MAKSFNDLPALVQGVILAAGAVILAGVVCYMYVWPLRAEKAALKAKVDALKKENEKNRVVEMQRTELLNRIKQLEQQLNTLRTIVPDEQATDQFVKMVYDTATGSTINLRSFVAQPLVARDFYMEMPFGIRIDGTYYAMLNFFDRLARQQRIVSVTGLALGPPAGGGAGKFTIHPSETVGANCVVTTFFNRPQPPPAPPQPKKR